MLLDAVLESGEPWKPIGGKMGAREDLSTGVEVGKEQGSRSTGNLGPVG